MSKNYRILPHTADLEIEVWGNSLLALASHAGMALADIIRGENKLPKGERLQENFQVESVDRASLLIDFLSDLLTWIEIEYCLPEVIIVHEFENNTLKATVKAVRVDGFEEEVKAVTYHGAILQKNREGEWKARFIVDI